MPVLEQHFARLEGDGVTAIMLDLRELTFLDCAALCSILAARDRASANGHRLILDGASSPARRLFELTGTQFLLDEQQAVSAVDLFAMSNDLGGWSGRLSVNADV